LIFERTGKVAKTHSGVHSEIARHAELFVADIAALLEGQN